VVVDVCGTVVETTDVDEATVVAGADVVVGPDVVDDDSSTTTS
jgi:2-keto-3-deoxy-6-phosphogluconate aldolase